ncbi:MAG: hypothetical protein JNL21_09520 [Myxococcales bacterium]|nr:hypothetical protein [Myxococcales bacterium]
MDRAPTEHTEIREASVRLTLAAAFDFAQRGYFSFLLCVLIMSASAAAAREHWGFATRASAEFEEAVRTLLDTRSEPRTSRQHAAATAIAIELAYVDRAFGCTAAGRTSAACTEMEKALTDWAKELAKTVTIDEKTPPHGLELCELDSSLKRHQLAYGNGLCARGAKGPTPGVLSLSPFVFDCDGERQTDPAEERARLWQCLGARTRREVVASAAVDAEVSAWLSSRAPFPDSASRAAAPVQVFYLSPEGVLRRWAAYDANPVAYLHDFRGRDYVTGVRDNQPLFETDIYLDEGGHGLVKTMCRRVEGEGRPGSSSAVVPLGVICIDYLPPAGMPEPSQRVVEHARVDVMTSDQPEYKSSLRPADIAAIDRSFRSQRDEDRVRVIEVVDAEPPLYLVPLAKVGERVSFVAIRPGAPGIPASFWLMVSSIAVALVTVVYVVAVRRRQFNVEDEYTILRKLQFGIIRANNRDEILEGNDCAEELLGVELPALGSHSATKGSLDKQPARRRYEELFHLDDIRQLSFEGPDPPNGLAKTIVTIQTFYDVHVARSTGAWSRYYLRKRNSALGVPFSEWLGIIGSPMLGEEGARGESFAILLVPSLGRRGELAKARLGEGSAT